jgi:dTDP-4-amino-4,6-dideoxygalactose transaminase
VTASTNRIVPFVDLTRQVAAIRAEIDEAIARVIDNGDFVSGVEVRRFESEFAAYCGVRFGIGVGSGTDALHLALRALGVSPGDEVITAANSFIATALAISYTGARPVLVDVDPRTGNIHPDQIERAITPRARVIVPVHLYGASAPMAPIMELARRRGLRVLEDGSQAHGATYHGRRVGSLGDVAAFSLYPTKPLGALGDAGIVVTDDPRIADRVRLLREHGQRARYHHEIKGFNSRLDTLQATALRIKLRYLDVWNARRRERAERYRALLADTPVALPADPPGCEHVYHLFPIRIPARDDLQRHLEEGGIATLIHYPVPIHLQPAYEEMDYPEGSFPEAEAQAREVLSLPMFAELTDAEQHTTAERIQAFFGSGPRAAGS